jgi:hypothetical protein
MSRYHISSIETVALYNRYGQRKLLLAKVRSCQRSCNRRTCNHLFIHLFFNFLAFSTHFVHQYVVSENASVLKRTFSLTVQHQEATVVLLKVQTKIQKIPTTVISDTEHHSQITRDPLYLLENHYSVGFVLQPKKEPCE